MKNIIFDLGGVILKGTPKDMFKNENEKLLSFFENSDDLDLGNITLEEKFNNCNFSEELIKEYKERLTKYYEFREINLDLINLIKKLKKNGYMIYILSDNNKETYDYCKELNIFSDIDGWVVSCEYHTMKKDKILFDIFLKKYDLDPKECYFIDDKESNVLIAKEYGIKGYVFDENKDISLLYNDMKDNGIILRWIN